MERAYDELAASPHAHSGGGGGGDAVTACLCSARAGRRAALEQEMLDRVDLQLQLQGGDRRKRRLMKNRESAARSRARKQAYMHELEKEVLLLRAEIDALRRHQCGELKAAAAAPVKKRLQRASSASF